MKKIILSTEDIFIYDGEVPMRILTSGIKLKRFKDNPIMLFNHNVNQVLGTWSDIKIEDNKLTAIPNFDEDEFSNVISTKYEKGTLKSASVGIDPVKMDIDKNGVLVITESDMYEASIASIPQNPNAKTLAKNKVLFTFSKDTEEKFNELKNKIQLMKEEQELLDNVEVPEAPLKAELEAELEDAKKEGEEKDAKLNELGKKLEDIEKAMAEMSASMKAKEAELEASRNDIAKLNKAIEIYKTEEVVRFLSESVSLGKITQEGANKLKSKGIEELKDLMEAIPASKNVNIVDKVNLSRKAEEKKNYKSYEWYLKNDRKALIELEKNDPEAMKKLQDEYLSK